MKAVLIKIIDNNLTDISNELEEIKINEEMKKHKDYKTYLKLKRKFEK